MPRYCAVCCKSPSRNDRRDWHAQEGDQIPRGPTAGQRSAGRVEHSREGVVLISPTQSGHTLFYCLGTGHLSSDHRLLSAPACSVQSRFTPLLSSLFNGLSRAPSGGCTLQCRGPRPAVCCGKDRRPYAQTPQRGRSPAALPGFAVQAGCPDGHIDAGRAYDASLSRLRSPCGPDPA